MIFHQCGNEIKNNKCHTVGTVSKSNRKSLKETTSITPNTNT